MLKLWFHYGYCVTFSWFSELNVQSFFSSFFTFGFQIPQVSQNCWVSISQTRSFRIYSLRGESKMISYWNIELKSCFTESVSTWFFYSRITRTRVRKVLAIWIIRVKNNWFCYRNWFLSWNRFQSLYFSWVKNAK